MGGYGLVKFCPVRFPVRFAIRVTTDLNLKRVPKSLAIAKYANANSQLPVLFTIF